MKKLLLFILISLPIYTFAQNVDYSVVSVPEESGIEFTPITSESDYVCMPVVKRTKNGTIEWLSNRIIATTPDGKSLGFLSARNNTTNVFVKDLTMGKGAIQRTSRTGVLDFSYSNDGKYLLFSEMRGNEVQIYQTAAEQGFTCRQITSANSDYSPVYGNSELIFFARQESSSTSIWSFNIKNNIVSNYTKGMNPCPIEGQQAYLCARTSADGRGEIWRVDYASNIEECLLSSPTSSFTTPMISPDGEWILMVGSSVIQAPGVTYANTDIYVCRMDGTQLTQLTYHAADDLSPAWGRDGRYIYFISQRGSANGTANVWRMTFNY